MAAAVLGKPGTEHGPCETPCEHIDCAANRRQAGSICRFCERRIGYEVGFYTDVKDETQLVHATCFEDSVEWELALFRLPAARDEGRAQHTLKGDSTYESSYRHNA